MIKKGLGKGLGALFSVYEEDEKEIENIEKYEQTTNIEPVKAGDEVVLNIETKNIIANPNQPRKIFEEGALNELAESIKQHGVIQPIVVTQSGDKYMIIAGERRFRASQLAGKTIIPAIVKQYTERQIKEISIIENLQREDLNPIETAKAIKDLMIQYKITQEEVADRIGKSRSSIANTLRLLTLQPEVIKMVVKNELSAGHARCLVSVEDAKLQITLANKAKNDKISVRELENAVKDALNPQPKKKPIERVQSIELKELVDNMQRVFSTRVSILGNDNKGRIYIDYFNRDDLDRICEMIETLSKNKK